MFCFFRFLSILFLVIRNLCVVLLLQLLTIDNSIARLATQVTRRCWNINWFSIFRWCYFGQKCVCSFLHFALKAFYVAWYLFDALSRSLSLSTAVGPQIAFISHRTRVRVYVLIYSSHSDRVLKRQGGFQWCSRFRKTFVKTCVSNGIFDEREKKVTPDDRNKLIIAHSYFSMSEYHWQMRWESFTGPYTYVYMYMYIIIIFISIEWGGMVEKRESDKRVQAKMKEEYAEYVAEEHIHRKWRARKKQPHLRAYTPILNSRTKKDKRWHIRNNLIYVEMCAAFADMLLCVSGVGCHWSGVENEKNSHRK